MKNKTWEIRDQMPNGSWGQYRTVTLGEFIADNALKSKIARKIYGTAIAKAEGAQ